MGESMEILARIPALPVQPEAVLEEATPPRRTAASRFPRSMLDGRSIITLAVIAVAVWSLAAWNEQARLVEQRRAARIAAQPPSLVAPETISP